MKVEGFSSQDSGVRDEAAAKQPVTCYLLPVTFLWAILIVVLSSLPYLVGMLFQPKGGVFTGFTFNIDDACVYSSWIRQIADGNLLIRNQFTSEPQTALQFNIFFVVLGLIAKITNLSPAAVLHLSRIVLGISLLLLIRKFSLRFLKTPLERSLIIPVVGLSGGLCWLISGIGSHKGPVDFWQPEANTFLSIYLNPLFLIGLILMISSLHFLYRLKATGSWRDMLLAGLMLLLLANVHTYDVVTVGAVWVVYLLVKIVKDRKIPWKTIGQSCVAAMMSAPALLYWIYITSNDAVLRERINSPAPSPALWAYLAGYGLILVFAAIGAFTALKERRGALLLAVWSVIGFALPYLPVAQQRKLVMGLHIPLAILATITVAGIASRAGKKNVSAVAFILILTLSLSNLFLVQDRTRMAEDIKLLKEQTTAPHVSPYLSSDGLAALRWLRQHSNRDDEVVLAFPDTALFTPVVAGNRVYYGHWSESPGYNEKLSEWLTFVDASTPDEWRKAYLERSRASYIIFPVGLSDINGMPVVDLNRLDYVEQVFESGDTAIFRVKSVKCKV